MTQPAIFNLEQGQSSNCVSSVLASFIYSARALDTESRFILPFNIADPVKYLTENVYSKDSVTSLGEQLAVYNNGVTPSALRSFLQSKPCYTNINGTPFKINAVFFSATTTDGYIFPEQRGTKLYPESLI